MQLSLKLQLFSLSNVFPVGYEFSIMSKNNTKIHWESFMLYLKYSTHIKVLILRVHNM